MIEKLQKMLTPSKQYSSVVNPMVNECVTLSDSEASNIFAVLLSVANLLDGKMQNGKAISEVDLADCLAHGMERMMVSTENLADVQRAWKGLFDVGNG